MTIATQTFPAVTSRLPEAEVIAGNELPQPHRSRRRPTRSATAGVVIVGAVLIFAIAGPWLITVDPNQQNLNARFAPPFWQTWDTAHLLGTDGLGRDLLARVASGTRASLGIGLAVTMVTMVLGTLTGLLAGVRGGWIDRLLGLLVDVQMAVPVIVLAIAMAALFTPGIPVVIVVLSSAGWVSYQRVVRVRARSLLRAGFVEASQASGATRSWVARKHLLPNLLGPIIVLATQQLAAVILFESALSYLGLGVPPSTITLGGMIANGRESMISGPWVVSIPGAMIALIATGLLLFGEGLRQQLDPRISS